MPGTELFGEEEKKEINDVMETGMLFRYNHDAQRNNIWKAREFEDEVKRLLGAKYAHAVSSGSTAVACALASAGIAPVTKLSFLRSPSLRQSKPYCSAARCRSSPKLMRLFVSAQKE